MEIVENIAHMGVGCWVLGVDEYFCWVLGDGCWVMGMLITQNLRKETRYDAQFARVEELEGERLEVRL